MQTINITINFKVEHNPDKPEHLEQVARGYFAGKGIILNEDNSIVI